MNQSFVSIIINQPIIHFSLSVSLSLSIITLPCHPLNNTVLFLITNENQLRETNTNEEQYANQPALALLLLLH